MIIEFETEVFDAPEQGTDKWLEWRKQGITATEAASIMFPDQHSSPLKVYTTKLGLTVSDQSDPEGYMEWDHRIEGLLVAKFMEQHPDFHGCSQGRLYQRDWCKCSLDASATMAMATLSSSSARLARTKRNGIRFQTAITRKSSGRCM
ncbi:MAG: YqaJ viral recombinase family protein [Fibrobacter sp.]|nr:YqaJ viral recombinase family protein [Fibrobacter sp.]MDY6368230.1 YqaJ viral recombinase family protein [Fibrobacter sp.]MDY6389648.1 YqaJ viral recombinase family protein [Fibrobacter sp.]